MSTNTTGAFSPTDRTTNCEETSDILEAAFEHLSEAYERTETDEFGDSVFEFAKVAKAEIKELKETDDEHGEQLDDVEAETAEVKETVEENTEQIEDVEQQASINESRLNGMCDSIERIEEEAETLNVDDIDKDEAEAAVRQISQTPIEKLTTTPEPLCESVNVKRARHLAMNIFKYGKKSGAGWYLTPEKITTLLHSYEGTNASEHYETVKRVRDVLDDFGGDDVTLEPSENNKTNVHFTDEIVRRLKNLAKIRERCPSLVCDVRERARG